MIQCHFLRAVGKIESRKIIQATNYWKQPPLRGFYLSGFSDFFLRLSFEEYTHNRRRTVLLT